MRAIRRIVLLVGSSIAEDVEVALSTVETWGVLIAALIVVVLALPAGRLAGAAGATALGAVAGLAFGATAVAARMLPDNLEALPASPPPGRCCWPERQHS